MSSIISIFIKLKRSVIEMEGHIAIMILTIAILVGTALIFREKKNYNRAPKRIWTYWGREDRIPKSVKMCLRNWAKWNPDYEIVLLTKELQRICHYSQQCYEPSHL